nr:unnamed protein product [Spirometra erinaceieuropaei]
MDGPTPPTAINLALSSHGKSVLDLHSWTLLSGHTPGNRLDRQAKPGEGAVRLCRVHSVLRTPLDVWSDETLRRHRRDEALLAEAVQAAVSHIANHDTTTTTTPSPPDSSDEDQDYTCPHCDRTFTSRIGLVGHLRIHRTEAGEPVP